MVEAKTQLLWLETTKKRQKKRQIGRNRGIPKTQLGFSLDQKNYAAFVRPCHRFRFLQNKFQYYSEENMPSVNDYSHFSHEDAFSILFVIKGSMQNIRTIYNNPFCDNIKNV
jgi:hypothetical protein